MVRVAWAGRLRPDKVEQYEAAHAAVWPDVLEAIQAAGIRNYSVFRIEDCAFGCYECDDPETAVALEAAAPATQRWRTWMLEFFDEEVASHGATYGREVFRLD